MKNLKNLITFERFTTHSDLRIADSQAFKDLVKKHGLEVITSPVQDRHNTVMVKMPIRMKQSEHSDTERVYVMYSNGYIRGESGGNWSSHKSYKGNKPSQYVIAKYDPIETEEDIIKMVNRLDQTLTQNFKLMQDYDAYKKSGKPYKDAPLSVLNLLSSKESDNKRAEIEEYWEEEFRKNPTFTTRVPMRYLERIDRKVAEQKMWYLKVKKDPTQIANLPKEFAAEIIGMTHPKLKNVAKMGVFDN